MTSSDLLDLDAVQETFDRSRDFTVGIEEEFALLDPTTLSLVPKFEELAAAASEDRVLSEAVAGELIRSEIEIRSGAGKDLEAAIEAQRQRRQALFELAARHGVALGATGTHPWADYRQQEIIDTEHYRLVERGLKYVAWRNNTFSLHVHIGIQGIDRAVKVCDRLRSVLPTLLAISANSPFLDGRDSGLHTARTQIFTKSFPRCGIPDSFGSWSAYREYIEFLKKTGSIVEFTQVWWSVRPHFRFGTVEVRICDAQTTAAESEALTALIVACVAQAAHDLDTGVSYHEHPSYLIEENFWRAIRHGLEGKLIDLDRGFEYPAADAAEKLLAWAAPACEQLGISVDLPELNGAQRQRRFTDSGATIADMFAGTVKETEATYAPGLATAFPARR